MKIKNKNAIFGKYPCCDFVNNAIRFILDGKTDAAVEELVKCIYKSNGHLHEDLQEKVNEMHERYWDEHRKLT
jgi:hypothetical protein